MTSSNHLPARIFDPDAYAASLLTNGEDALVRQHLYGWEDGLASLRARPKGSIGGPTDAEHHRVRQLKPVLADLIDDLGRDYTWIAGGGPGVMEWVQEMAGENLLRIRRPRTGALPLRVEGPRTLDVSDANSRERALQRAAFTILVTIPSTASGTNDLFYRTIEASKYEIPRPLIILQPEPPHERTREVRMARDVARNGVPLLVTDNAADASAFVRGFYRNVKDLRIFTPGPSCSRESTQVLIELRTHPTEAEVEALNECSIRGQLLFAPESVRLLPVGVTNPVITAALQPQRRYADLTKAVEVCNGFSSFGAIERRSDAYGNDLSGGIRSRLAPTQSQVAIEATRALSEMSPSNRKSPDGLGISLPLARGLF